MNYAGEKGRLILGMSVSKDEFSFATSIESALISSETEIQNLKETIKSVENLGPNCDKLDYALGGDLDWYMCQL